MICTKQRKMKTITDENEYVILMFETGIQEYSVFEEDALV